MDQITKRKSDSVFIIGEDNLEQLHQLHSEFTSVGYQNILITNCIGYYMDSYRLKRFANKYPFMVVDCYGNYGKHIYFDTKDNRITTMVFSAEISKSYVVKKLFLMASSEFHRSYSIDLTTNSSYSKTVTKNCEDAYDYLKGGNSCVAILLEVDGCKLKVFMKDSNIRYIEQQLVLNHIKSHLGMTTERLKEIGVILLGEGVYYDACQEVVNSNELAEKVTILQPLSSPCYSLLASNVNPIPLDKGTRNSIHSIIQSFGTNSSSLASSYSWKEDMNEYDNVEYQEDFIMGNGRRFCSLTHKDLPFCVELRGVFNNRNWLHSESTPFEERIPAISLSEMIEYKNDENVISMHTTDDSGTSYNRSLRQSFEWTEEPVGELVYTSCYYNEQLIYQGWTNKKGMEIGTFYDLSLNQISVIVNKKVVYQRDDWIEKMNLVDSVQWKCYRYHNALCIENGSSSIRSDRIGNIDVVSNKKKVSLGFHSVVSYPDTQPEGRLSVNMDEMMKGVLTNKKNDIKEKGYEEWIEESSQWDDLDGDFLENAWIQSTSHLFEDNEEEDDDLIASGIENSFNSLLQSAEELVPKGLLTSIPDRWLLFEKAAQPKEECTDLETFDLHLEVSDDITHLEGFRFETMDSPNKGRLVSSSGEMVFCGSVNNNKLNGIGSWFYKNGGKCYEGEFQDNLKHGKGKLYFPNGTLRYDGEWKMDIMEGNGRLYRPVHLQYSNSDVRKFIIEHGANSENLSFARGFDFYSLGE